MGFKLGSLAAGIGLGYMAADKWKSKKAKDEPSEPGAKVYRGYGSGYGVEESSGPGDGVENMANGGLVGGSRWYGKKKPK